eukprot:3408031-Amphidinium_carterae.1
MWVGEPDLGKTPAANTLVVLLSAFCRQRDGVDGEPSFKTGTDLDFFRTDPGRKVVPAIFDDAFPSVRGLVVFRSR